MDLGYNHGYVVSIVNAYHQTDAYDNSNNLGQYYKWGNSAANIWDIVSVNAEVLTTENGYERTYMDEKASQCYAAQIAKNFGSHEEQSQYLNPAKISGWFCLVRVCWMTYCIICLEKLDCGMKLMDLVIAK